MKKGMIFFFFVSYLFASVTLEPVYTVKTNSLKSVAYQNGLLMYATAKNVYVYDMFTKIKKKKNIDNIVKAGLYKDGEKIAVLNRLDSIRLYDRTLHLLKKIPGNYKNMFVTKYGVYVTDNNHLYEVNFFKGKVYFNSNKSNIVSISYDDKLTATLTGVYYGDTKILSFDSRCLIKKAFFVKDDEFLILRKGKVEIYNIYGKKLQTIDLGYETIKSVALNNENIYIATDNKIYIYREEAKFKKIKEYQIKPVDLFDLIVNDDYLIVAGKYNINIYPLPDQYGDSEQNEITGTAEDTGYRKNTQDNEKLNVQVSPKSGKAPMKVLVELNYDFDGDAIQKLNITFDDNNYNILNKQIKKFNFIFTKPGIHKIEIFMQTDTKTFHKEIFVNVEKE